MSRRSYWHSNGFAKHVVHVNNEPEFRLRLHVWPADGRRGSGDENIHNHRWPIASIVLAGAIRVDQYREVDDFDGPDTLVCNRLVYEAAAPGQVGDLRVQGKRALGRLGIPEYRAGTVYFCDTDMLHTVAPATVGTTATLMLAGAATGREALVYQDVARKPLADTNLAIGPPLRRAFVSFVLADGERSTAPSHMPDPHTRGPLGQAATRSRSCSC